MLALQCLVIRLILVLVKAFCLLLPKSFFIVNPHPFVEGLYSLLLLTELGKGGGEKRREEFIHFESSHKKSLYSQSSPRTKHKEEDYRM